MEGVATELGARIRAVESERDELRVQLAALTEGGGRGNEGALERLKGEKEAAEREVQRVRTVK